MDVTQLSQASPLIIFSEIDTSQGETFSWNSKKESFLGLERSDLSDYLRDRAEFDAVDGEYSSRTNLNAPSSSLTTLDH